MMSARVRRWLGNLVAMLVSLAVVFGACEIAARIAYANRRGKEQAEVERYTDFDPDVGWAKRPGARVHYNRTEYQVEVSINALGLRDRERTRTPAPGTQRVLALGDSFVEAYTVDAKEMVTQVMERNLSRPDCPVEVLNGGTTGYSTDQELAFYRKLGRSLQPNVVVLFFYYNDIVDNANHHWRPKPAFAVKSGKLVLVRKAIPPPPSQAEEAPPPTPEGPRGSAAWGWLKSSVRRAAPKLYNRVAALGVWPPLQQTEKTPDEMLVYRPHQPRRVRRAWALTEALLGALAREVAADGAQFLVVYIPSRMEVRDADWEATRILYGMGHKWAQDTVVRHLEKVGLKRGFPVLDLTPALRDAEGRWTQTTYLTFDGHWNAVGHRVAGETAAEDLKLRGWLDACPGAAR